MRTTLDLPKPLMDEAMKVSSHRTKTAVIIGALEDLIRKNRIRGLKRYKGRVNLNVDLAALRDRK